MAKIKISPDLRLDLIAEAAGQPDDKKRLYRDGFLIVEGISQQALEAAAATPPIAPDIVPEPSDIEIRLAALEAKVGIDDSDKEAAKTAILEAASVKIAEA